MKKPFEFISTKTILFNYLDYFVKLLLNSVELLNLMKYKNNINILRCDTSTTIFSLIYLSYYQLVLHLKDWRTNENWKINI